MSNYRRRGANWKKARNKKSRDGFVGQAVPQCPYCGQSVRDVLTAIATTDEQVPAHFDCVLKKIAEQEPLQPKEKIVYLGNGSFGIVRFRGASENSSQFVIRKRMRIEAENTDVSWRKSVSMKLNNK